jgi:hypothetical protein
MTKLRMAAYLKIRYLDGRSRRFAAVVSSRSLLVDIAKALEGFALLFRPTYAVANVGHPSGSYWVLLGRRTTPRNERPES